MRVGTCLVCQVHLERCRYILALLVPSTGEFERRKADGDVPDMEVVVDFERGEKRVDWDRRVLRNRLTRGDPAGEYFTDYSTDAVLISGPALWRQLIGQLCLRPRLTRFRVLPVYFYQLKFYRCFEFQSN